MRLIIPSVGYADYLAVTLPAWRAVLPLAFITVVTGPGDEASRRVARQHAAMPLVTASWTRDGAQFNKAAALDDALPDAAVGDVVIVADADVYPCGRFPQEDEIKAGTLYGAPRYECLTPEALRAHQSGDLARERTPLILPRRKGEPSVQLKVGASAAEAEAVARRGLGYFQCFRYAGQSFGSSQTAGGYDVRFARTFQMREPLPGDFYVLHLGEQDRRNWQGRVLPQWGAA